MLYAILCYHQEDIVCSWSREEDDAVIAKLALVQDRLAKAGKLGPVARLLPTTAATTLRKDQEPPLVIDGPFAETKEQLLGFYVVDCTGLDEALAITQDLAKVNPGGAYEIRPLGVYRPSQLATDAQPWRTPLDRCPMDRDGVDDGPAESGRGPAAVFP